MIYLCKLFLSSVCAFILFFALAALILRLFIEGLCDVFVGGQD